MRYILHMAHIHEKIDFTASAFIVRDGALLLHKHKKLNTWLQPGGHIELDEDPNEAVVREVREETGLEVELVRPHPATAQAPGDLTPPFFLNRHYFNEAHDHEHLDLGYLARVKGGDLRPEDGTATELRWFTREEIVRNDVGLHDTTRAYSLAAIDMLSPQ